MVPTTAVVANGVPVNVGLLANTTAPVPVSSVSIAAKLVDVGVARNALAPASIPVISVTAIDVSFALIVTLPAALVSVTLVPAFILIVLDTLPSNVYRSVPSVTPVSNFITSVLFTLVAVAALPLIVV